MSEVRNSIRPKAAAPKQVKQKSQKPVKEKKKSGPSKTGKMLQSVLGGAFLEKDMFLKNLPFIFFMSFLALMYIANTYLAEKTIRDIEKTKTMLKEMRSEYITSKSELMTGRKQSEVARKFIVAGLKESLDSPRKIVKEVEKEKTEETK